MKDLYNKWNTEKQLINEKETGDFFINPREIWFTKMGQNIGYEENGKKEFSRPVLVLRKVGNLFLTVALTTKGKSCNKFYYSFKNVVLYDNHIKNRDRSSVILSQLKVMDKRRFEEKIGIINKDEFKIIKQKIIALML